MADGVPITAGAGTTVATDDVAGIGHVQRVKLVDGALDSGAPIGGDAANGLDVDVTRVSGVVHVDDNAGSLTVDGSVSVLNLPATQPVSGSVAVSNFPGTQPVSLAAAVDVSDRDARAAGRVRIWNGTNPVSVLGRDVDPASSDFGLAVVPMKSTRPGYQVVTGEITSATATGVKENLTLWHPATLAKDVFILEIGVNVRVVQTAGTFAWELQFISAENATPGGTTLTPQQFNRGDAASGLTVRQVPTGAPTVTGALVQRASFPLPAAAAPWTGGYDGFIVFYANDLESYSDALILRSGQAEGLRISQNILAALTTAPVFSVFVRYVERA